MPPILCVVGAHNVGKTTVLEKLIPELTRRGYRVGTVKHDVHGFEMDREGKDTWRHRQAGSGTVVISSPAQVACIRQVDVEMDLGDVVNRFLWNEDLVLVEGYKRSHYPKIEVFRTEIEEKPLCGAESNLRALITDDTTDLDLPAFRFDNTGGVADFIENTFLKDRRKRRVDVRINGKRLPMKDFVEDFVAGGLVGMLETLRGFEKGRTLDVHIEYDEEP